MIEKSIEVTCRLIDIMFFGGKYWLKNPEEFYVDIVNGSAGPIDEHESYTKNEH